MGLSTSKGEGGGCGCVGPPEQKGKLQSRIQMQCRRASGGCSWGVRAIWVEMDRNRDLGEDTFVQVLEISRKGYWLGSTYDSNSVVSC